MVAKKAPPTKTWREGSYHEERDSCAERKRSRYVATMNTLPIVYIARHGETAWSITGQHTGLTDLPLTPQGECNARRLREPLAGLRFDKVVTSPLQRARRTCELAGFGAVAEVDENLVEWDYGDYEGLTTSQIRAHRPEWELFRDGAPGGESIAQVTARADAVLHGLRSVAGDILLFSSGHFIRVMAARWIGLELSAHCASFLLSTASLSEVGYDGDLSRPVIRLWNDTHHLLPDCAQSQPRPNQIHSKENVHGD